VGYRTPSPPFSSSRGGGGCEGWRVREKIPVSKKWVGTRGNGVLDVPSHVLPLSPLPSSSSRIVAIFIWIGGGGGVRRRGVWHSERDGFQSIEAGHSLRPIETLVTTSTHPLPPILGSGRRGGLRRPFLAFFRHRYSLSSVVPFFFILTVLFLRINLHLVLFMRGPALQRRNPACPRP